MCICRYSRSGKNCRIHWANKKVTLLHLCCPEYSGEETTSTVGSFDPNEKDQLFEEAARIIVSTQQGSTSMLTKSIKIGLQQSWKNYGPDWKAAGIVGGFNGAKAREVMISDLNSLESFLEELRK